MKSLLLSLLLVIYVSPPATFGGECLNGDCLNGWGTYSWPDNSKYEGQWKDGRFHGTGIYTFPDGGKYIGQMRDNERVGQGIMYYPDGGKYVGQWRYGDMDGNGTYTYPDGSKYEGRWKNGKYHGRGTYIYNDKDARFKFAGRFRYGKKHGYGTGTMIYKDGCRFVGRWKDDRPHEFGTITYPDGTKLVGSGYDLYTRQTQKSQTQYSDGYGTTGKYERIIIQASKQFGVSRSLIKAIIKAESDFDSWAVSRKGAQGLMQLMPQTAQAMAVDDPFNPGENILGGTHYLSLLLKRFENDMTLALAAYNAGPEKVEIHQGVPPIAETRTYVKRVMGYYRFYSGESY